MGTVPQIGRPKTLYSSMFSGHFSNLGFTTLNLEFYLFKIKIIFFDQFKQFFKFRVHNPNF